jgi:hypothetical protein
MPCPLKQKNYVGIIMNTFKNLVLDLFKKHADEAVAEYELVKKAAEEEVIPSSFAKRQ